MGRSWGQSSRRGTPPEARAYTANLTPRVNVVGAPNLRPVERTIIVLVSRPGEWFVVDEFRGTTHTPSAIRQQLWRRGFEVIQRRHANSPDLVQVWARWTHPVPTEVT